VVIITVNLDVPISFVLDDRGGSLSDAVQTPGLDSFGLCIVDTPGRIKQLCVGSDETKIVLTMNVE